MIFEEDYFLEHIPSRIHTKIKTILDHNDSWKKIQKFDELFEKIKPPKYLSPQKSPSEYMLDRLIEKLCTMGNLRTILLQSELYEALSVFYTEKMEIITQPTKNLEESNYELFIKRGEKLSLEFSVWGIPQPTFHWYRDEELLSDQTSFELFYEHYTPNLEGDYHCIATQTIEDHITNTTKVHKKKSDIVTVITQHQRCTITKIPPTEVCCRVGEPPIVLHVVADGYPNPRFQWVHKNEVLNNKKNKIQIPTEINKTGLYRCYISNGINDLVVTTAVKIIDPTYKFPICLDPVTEKVALLIGNEAYMNQAKLSTPENDTKALQKKLESIGFLVLCANNLTLNGMTHALEYFRKLCVPGSIAFFYYAGHGFEFGEKYLMPIDVPNNKNYGFKHCVCEFKIFRDILSRKPKLFTVLLDMCLTYPNKTDNPDIYKEQRELYSFECDRNLIRGYATTTGYSSMEIEQMKHSIYNCLLQDYITKNIPIEQMLRNISHEFEILVQKNKRISKQMPTITHNITKDYYLHVEKTGHPPSKKMLDDLQQLQTKTQSNIREN